MKRYRRHILFFLVLSIGFFSSVRGVSAQNEEVTGTPYVGIDTAAVLQKQIEKIQEAALEIMSQAITMKVSPTLPEAGDTVSVTLNGYSTNISAARITWRLNGVTQKTGIGVDTFQFTAGGIGSRSVIQAVIETSDGFTISKNVTVAPANVDLIWEADTYAPPFYKGKALLAPQAGFKVTALPEIVEGGVRINSQSLLYKWSQDGKILGSQSGYGRSSLTVPSRFLVKPIVVSVVITSANGTETKKSITVRTSQSKVVIYENNPFNGIRFNQALTEEFSMTENELTLIAIPYFFNPLEKGDSALTHVWRMNGELFDTGVGKNTITLRQPDIAGFSNINIEVESRNKILQAAKSGLVLKFEGANDIGNEEE